jgi:hypothetical protein
MRALAPPRFSKPLVAPVPRASAYEYGLARARLYLSGFGARRLLLIMQPCAYPVCSARSRRGMQTRVGEDLKARITIAERS